MRQAEIDKAPEGVATILRIGELVNTPEGPGQVIDIEINLAEYDGKVLLEPPVIAVKLNSGKKIHVCLCGLDFGDKHINLYVKDEFARLWPPMDTVPEAETLVPDNQDINLELHTGVAEEFDKSVLIGEEVDFFAPEISAMATARPASQDIAIINNLAYIPLFDTVNPKQKNIVGVHAMHQDVQQEMHRIPRDRLDDLNFWLERQFVKKVQYFLAVPA